MKKKFLSIFIIALMILPCCVAFSACGSDKTPTDATAYATEIYNSFASNVKYSIEYESTRTLENDHYVTIYNKDYINYNGEDVNVEHYVKSVDKNYVIRSYYEYLKGTQDYQINTYNYSEVVYETENISNDEFYGQLNFTKNALKAFIDFDPANINFDEIDPSNIDHFKLDSSLSVSIAKTSAGGYRLEKKCGYYIWDYNNNVDLSDKYTDAELNEYESSPYYAGYTTFQIVLYVNKNGDVTYIDYNLPSAEATNGYGVGNIYAFLYEDVHTNNFDTSLYATTELGVIGKMEDRVLTNLEGSQYYSVETTYTVSGSSEEEKLETIYDNVNGVHKYIDTSSEQEKTYYLEFWTDEETKSYVNEYYTDENGAKVYQTKSLATADYSVILNSIDSLKNCLNESIVSGATNLSITKDTAGALTIEYTLYQAGEINYTIVYEDGFITSISYVVSISYGSSTFTNEYNYKYTYENVASFEFDASEYTKVEAE